MIFLPKTMPNGAQAERHRIDSIAIRDTIVVTVNSYTSGDVLCWQEPIALPLSLEANVSRQVVEERLCAAGAYLDGGKIVANPTAIEALRATMLATLSNVRDDHLCGGCKTSFGPVDSGMVSRQNISGAVAMAQIAKAAAQTASVTTGKTVNATASTNQPAFSIRWRLKNNGYVTLDADQMITMGVVVGTFVNAVYARSFTLKDSITSATTIEALKAINVYSGWPE